MNGRRRAHENIETVQDAVKAADWSTARRLEAAVQKGRP